MRYKIMEACVPKQKSTKGKVDFKFRISSLLVWLCTYDMWSSNVFGALPTLQGFFFIILRKSIHEHNITQFIPWDQVSDMHNSLFDSKMHGEALKMCGVDFFDKH